MKLPGWLKELTRYPSAVAGILIILTLVVVAIYAVVAIPYDKAVQLWRGDEKTWYRNPKYASPEWVNIFRKQKLAKSLSLSTFDGNVQVTQELDKNGHTIYTMTFPFEYTADVFPQEMILYFTTVFTEKKPYVSAVWVRPDGKEIRIGDFALDKKSQSFWFSQDQKLKLRVGNIDPLVGLFAEDPKADKLVPLKGQYEIRMQILTFEPDTKADAEFVLHGQVAGWAGTDHLRRDLGIAMLWGTPIALGFGLVASLLITVAHMAIAAAGVWFGGWVDELIQRITEIFIVLPFLSILIMIGTFYSRSITTIFLAVILLSLFGSAIKGLRATFMQIKESSYIEAARAYGANNLRIIFLYLIPRLVPLLIPALVTSIPGYVFLEASLAVLGLGDPTLPTWGKAINDAFANGALYKGLYYWVLQPSALLMFAGLGFALLGFSLDRVFNPRLRGI